MQGRFVMAIVLACFASVFLVRSILELCGNSVVGSPELVSLSPSLGLVNVADSF